MAAQFVVIVSFAVLLGACVIPTAYPFGSAPRWRPKPLRLRVGVSALLAALVFPLIAPALPERLIPWSFRPVAQAAEVLNAPEYIDVAVMPNGQVGAIFVNDAGGGSVETRFKRYFAEQGMDPSTQLSTVDSCVAYQTCVAGGTARVVAFSLSTTTDVRLDFLQATGAASGRRRPASYCRTRTVSSDRSSSAIATCSTGRSRRAIRS